MVVLGESMHVADSVKEGNPWPTEQSKERGPWTKKRFRVDEDFAHCSFPAKFENELKINF